MSEAVNTIITTTPVTILGASIFALILTGKAEYGFFALLMLVNGGLNFLLKELSKKLLGKNSTLGKRPSGCGKITENSSCVGCGVYPEKGSVSETWGMPSGHAQTMAFVATFWTCHVMESKEWKLAGWPNISYNKKMSIVLMWLISLIVCGQRLYVKCHSVTQVVTGFIIGVGCGIGGYHIAKRFFPNM